MRTVADFGMKLLHRGLDRRRGTAATASVRKVACSGESRATRVAIVGYGGMADRHLDAFGAIGGIDVVGVSGRDAAKAQAFGERRGIPSFAELDKMLDEAKPD